MSRYGLETKTFYSASIRGFINGHEIEPLVIEVQENKEDIDIEWVYDLYKNYLRGIDNADPFLEVVTVQDVSNTPGYRVIIPFEKVDALSVDIEEVEVPKLSPGVAEPNW